MQSLLVVCLPCRERLLAAALHRARVPTRLHSAWQPQPQPSASASARSTSSTTSAPTSAFTPPSRSASAFTPPPTSASAFTPPPTSAPAFTPPPTSASAFTPPPPPFAESNLDQDFISSIDALDIDIDIEEPWRVSDDASTPHDQHDDKSPADGTPAVARFQTLPRQQASITEVRSRASSFKLFEKVVRKQNAQDSKADADAKDRDMAPEAVEFYRNLARVRLMMKEKPIDQCLDFFLTELWSKAPFEGRHRLLKQRGVYLMSKVAEAKMADPNNEKLPSVAQIAQHFHDFDDFKPEKWCQMMMALIEAIAAISPVPEAHASVEEHTSAMAKKTELCNDLVDSWAVFFRCKMRPDDSTLQTSAEAEFRLPEIDLEQMITYARKQDYKKALGRFFADRSPSCNTQIPAVAMATFVLLLDPTHSNDTLRQRARPLLAPIAHMVKIHPPKPETLSNLMAPHPTVLLYIRGQWDMLIRRLHGTAPDEEGHDRRKDRQMEGLDRLAFSKIETARGLGDVEGLKAAWSWFWAIENSNGNRKRLVKEARIFDQFIMAFAALKEPNCAMDVWQAMVHVAKAPPTIRTWTALLEGCKRAKNTLGMETVWRKFTAWAEAAKQPLTAEAWSCRVVGLMEGGVPKMGLRALVEMVELSKTAGGTKLNIYVVNAAVGSLVRLNSMSAAKKVLDWSSQQYDGDDKIQPDIVTYNTLLGVLVRLGDSAQIKSMLQSMTANGVKADVTTYTLLLDGLLGEDVDSVQQAIQLQQLLFEMEEDGVEVSKGFLSRVLHLVLRNGTHQLDHTKGAAGVLLAYMRQHNQAFTSHMTTTLIDHYFARTPPALAEIEAIVQHNRTQDGIRHEGRRDRVFWERIIYGFALAGEVQKAFAYFEKIINVGTVITLGTSEALLRGLVTAGEREMATRVVHAIKRHGSARIQDINNSVKADKTGTVRSARYWRHGFWMHAMEAGLLAPEEWRRLQVEPTQGLPSA